MTSTSQHLRALKTLTIAATLVGASALSFAQGNPPNTVAPNPATAAGQQTQQGTPMGTTGVLTPNRGGNAGMAAAPAPAAAPMAPMASGDSGAAPQRMARADRPMRRARADRN